MSTTIDLSTALTPDVDLIAKAIAQTYEVTFTDTLIPTLSATLTSTPYTPAQLDTSHLPAFYLFRVGDQFPDVGVDGHSTENGTFLRDFEFHLATATINQQNDPDREVLSRKILSGCIYNWSINYDLKYNGAYVPFVEDWWYTGDRGLAVLREYDQKYLGSILTFRVRTRWLRS